jgi:hypothetical protein
MYDGFSTRKALTDHDEMVDERSTNFRGQIASFKPIGQLCK